MNWIPIRHFPTIQVGENLFAFVNLDDWIDHAQVRFRRSGHTSQTTICIDDDGHVCTRGAHFKIAKYPVNVFAIDNAPYPPAGMLADRGPLPEEFQQ